MSDLLIKRAMPNAAALVDAVGNEDPGMVEDILTTLTTTELHALCIVLAAQVIPASTETEQMRKAVAYVAGTFGITGSVLLGTSRRREAVDARAVVAYVGHLLGMSSVRIGKEIGRDHSTALHAIGRVGETPRLRGIAQRVAESLGWDREAGVA